LTDATIIEYFNLLKELVIGLLRVGPKQSVLLWSGTDYCPVKGRESLTAIIMLYCNVYTKKFVMTLQQAQQDVDGWIKTLGVRYFSELTNMTILTEEVGELARIMARTYGDQSFKKSDEGKNLGDEMADVLWVLICLANQTGVDLTEALEKNFEKKNIRDGERHKNNEKLNP
jgi:NTP pyrophosphatase (non-canonical NTP hydrolase)